MKKKIKKNDQRKYSKKFYDGFERAPSRSMLYPLGFKKEDFPAAEKFHREAISLPMYPTLSAKEQNKVIKSLVSAIKKI